LELGEVGRGVKCHEVSEGVYGDGRVPETVEGEGGTPAQVGTGPAGVGEWRARKTP
jgi:hypothetical protein